MRSTKFERIAQTLDFTCGAACFEAMFRHFRGHSPGQMHFAKELGSLDLGFTPPKNVVALAKRYGFKCNFKEDAAFSEVKAAFQRDAVVFLTWWDEDAGHYSLLQDLNADLITLMDPWAARQDQDTILPLSTFEPLWKMRGSVMIAVIA